MIRWLAQEKLCRLPVDCRCAAKAQSRQELSGQPDLIISIDSDGSWPCANIAPRCTIELQVCDLQGDDAVTRGQTCGRLRQRRFQPNLTLPPATETPDQTLAGQQTTSSTSGWA